MEDAKRILAVALDAETLDRIGPVLKRSTLAIEAVAQGEEAATRAVREQFHLVICRYPLPDLKLREFVAIIHGGNSSSRDASLLLLTIPEMMTEARYPRLKKLFGAATRLEADFWQMGLDAAMRDST